MLGLKNMQLELILLLALGSFPFASDHGEDTPDDLECSSILIFNSENKTAFTAKLCVQHHHQEKSKGASHFHHVFSSQRHGDSEVLPLFMNHAEWFKFCFV